MRAEKRVEIFETGIAGAREHIFKGLAIMLMEELLKNGYITIRAEEDSANCGIIISAEVKVVRP